MNNTSYGGRYSKNLIHDVSVAGETPSLPQIRSGQSNYRPFEELAQSLNLTSSAAVKTHKYIDVKFRGSQAAIGVMRMPRHAFGYTFVPPISTLDNRAVDLGFHMSQATKIVGAIGGSVTSSSQKIGAIALAGLALIISVPLKIGGWARSAVFGRHYSSLHGVSRLRHAKRSTYLKASLASLLVIAGIVAFTSILADPQLRPNSHHAKGTFSTTSDNQGTNKTSTTASGSGHSGAGPTSATSSSAGSAASSSSPGSDNAQNSTTGTSRSGYYSGGSGTVGRGGGTATTPTPAAGGGTGAPSNTVSLPNPVPAPGPNPADAIPYGSYPTPPSSVQTGGKQVIGSSGPTLVTN